MATASPGAAVADAEDDALDEAEDDEASDEDEDEDEDEDDEDEDEDEDEEDAVCGSVVWAQTLVPIRVRLRQSAMTVFALMFFIKVTPICGF
ncbi:hypothetical protein EM6_1422 [Asticcacaulis excentricus]|uniref:Uncharacterized protein n=1 Tax=Asticcacaulis excentricus TaxID=78587 RepID=A0A3G9G2G3_9CAUL|nr:hypothetical protein EM6_1422 [Asticcacaulis excentricus]